MELAIRNLIENSIKYSQEDVKVEIFLKREKEKISLSIKDSGNGIEAKDLPFVFNRFYTADKARSRKYGGVGLGLSLVKKIIEKHGGTVGILSEVKKGTEVTIQLFP